LKMTGREKEAVNLLGRAKAIRAKYPSQVPAKQ
jgi:hypothetical protein